jgi:hypothetical protein
MFDVNVIEPLLKTIQEIGLYNVIQVIIDNASNCKDNKINYLRMYIITYFG